MSINDLLTDARQLLKQGATEAAARACQQALRQEPDCVPAITLMAKIARTADEPAAAERLVHHALRGGVGLGDGELWFQLALALVAQHRLPEAAQAYYQVVLTDPRAVATWINLTSLNVDLDLWRQGEYCARRALECDPKSTAALINLGEVLRRRSKIEGTIACLEEALRINPESPLAHWNLSLAVLARGDFERGWAHYEWRERANQVSLDPYPQPRWNGEPLTNQRLLVHAEQGLGDEILFASCYDDLLRLGGHCVLACDPRLVPIFRRSFPAATVIGFQRRKDRQPATPDKPVDWQIPAGSLPKLFRRRAEDFPNRRRFLTADPALTLRWRERLESLGRSLKVGISWRAGGKLTEQRKRTTRLDQWQSFLATPGVSWINLQYGDTADDKAWAQSALGITIHDWPEGDPLVDVDAFSARMAALDLVVCVDNSTAHLGGALGVETWVLLPLVPDWRWGLESESSLWYPSLRLVRQTATGAWEPLFLRLAAELRTAPAMPAQPVSSRLRAWTGLPMSCRRRGPSFRPSRAISRRPCGRRRRTSTGGGTTRPRRFAGRYCRSTRVKFARFIYCHGLRSQRIACNWRSIHCAAGFRSSSGLISMSNWRSFWHMPSAATKRLQNSSVQSPSIRGICRLGTPWTALPRRRRI